MLAVMTPPDPQQPSSEDPVARMRAARSQHAIQGERRVLTILFCDVADSTAMADQLDPEDWAEIMNEAFDYMITPVYRYEGIVARLMGDSILAFFGAPVAHEDDPQRAVLAGLGILEGLQPFRRRLQDRFGIDFNVRVGINTGEVVVGKVGTDDALEYTAMGDAVNLAARMEQTATPGTVQITEETCRLVAPLFEVEAVRGVEVKGKHRSLTTYQVLNVMETTAPARGAESLQASLIGREKELATLQAAVRKVWGGEGHVVFLVGEAGLGKSRLIEEIRPFWEEDAAYNDTWLQVRGVSYERDRPYGLVSQYFRQRFGITSEDSAESMHAKLMSVIRPGPSSDLYEVLLHTFVSLTNPPGESVSPDQALLHGEAVKHRLLTSIYEIFAHSLSLTPLAFVMDDLQWTDPASIDLVRHLIHLTEEFPALFLCALHPHSESPGWQLKETIAREHPDAYSEITLQPLGETDNDALVGELLAHPQPPGEVKRLIYRKAEGNPFFTEELIRALIESEDFVRDETGQHWIPARKIAEIVIPDNVITLLTARMDRLSPAARDTLQAAAVIGRTFQHALLREVSGAPESTLDQHLAELQRADLIAPVSEGEARAYAFRHDLTRDAAYQSLLHRNRRTWHKKVAESIERLASGRLHEEASRLAFHFEQAGQPQQAVLYHSQAGDEAARLFAHPEAITHYRRAIALAGRVEDGGEQLTDLFLRLGRSLELDSQFDAALHHYVVMERQGRARGDPEMELKALIKRGQIHATPNVKYDFEQGERLAQQALALAESMEAREAQAQVYWNLINLYRLSSRWAEGKEAGERAVSLARELGQKELLAHTLNDLSHVYMSHVDPRAAQDLLEEAGRLWREADNKPMLADTLGTMSLADYLLGDFEAALAHSEEAQEISLSINNLWGQAYSLLMIGDVYWERGQVDRAIASLEQSIHLGEKAGFLVPQVDNRAFLGLLYGYLGDFERGLALAHAAAELAERSGAPYLHPSKGFLAEIYVIQGNLDAAERLLAHQGEMVLDEPVASTFSYSALCRLMLARGAYQEACDMADNLLALLKSIGFRIFLPKILYHKGEALRAQGHLSGARESLLAARAEATDIGARTIMWLILGSLAAVESARKEPETAERLRLEAIEIIGRIADTIPEKRLRESFLNMANVRAITSEGG